MKKFKWSSSENNVFDNSYGSQEITECMSSFSKTDNATFVMNAPGDVLVLNSQSAYPGDKNYTAWPAGIFTAPGPCINIEAGELYFTSGSHMNSYESSLILGNERNHNNTLATIDVAGKLCLFGMHDNTTIKINNLALNIQSGGSTEINEVNSLNFTDNNKINIPGGSLSILNNYVDIKDGTTDLSIYEKGSVILSESALLVREKLSTLNITLKDNATFTFHTTNNIVGSEIYNLNLIADDNSSVVFDVATLIALKKSIFTQSKASQIRFKNSTKNISLFDFTSDQLSPGTFNLVTAGRKYGQGSIVLDNVTGKNLDALLNGNFVAVDGVVKEIYDGWTVKVIPQPSMVIITILD